MCQRGLRSEQRNQGLLLLLLAGVLVLFSASSPRGSWGFPSCEARLLRGELLGNGGRRAEDVSNATRSPAAPSRASSPAAALPQTVPMEGRKPAPSPAPSAPSPAASLPAGTNPGARAQSHPVQSKSRGFPLLWAFLIGPAAFVSLVAMVVAGKVRLAVRKRRREAGTTWKREVSFDENKQLEKYTFAGVPTISFEEVDAACEEFTNVIGTSTDCVVFKGTRVSDGLQIAVTRMRIPPERWTARRELGFRHKVEDLARMKHDNMVNLIAYCATDAPFERMLVFEYASNGTLYEHLHSRGAAEDHLDWPTRMRIVMGAACGLEYLHHKLVPPTSHFKFDARHVFLTEDYAAKLADFAISPDSVEFNLRTLGRRKSFAKIATAVGYNEWEAHKHTPNLESNIRSFGVFLMEVITARRPFTDTQGPLLEWAKEYLHDPEKMWLMVDPSLKDYKKAELEAICEVVRLCIRPKGNRLPSMNELADILSKGLRMTRDAANRKTSPLLWAEMQLLASLEHSVDDGSFGAGSPKNSSINSPKQRTLSSQDSSNKLGSPRGPLSPGTPKKVLSRHGSLNPDQMAAKQSKLSSNNSKRSWGVSNASERELLSPEDSLNSESQEVPLAASINSFGPGAQGSQESFGRSFRRVWVENNTEMSALDGRGSRSNSLGR